MNSMLPGNPRLPPGRDIDGPEDRDDDDGFTERERAREEAAEHDADCEREEA